MKRPLYHSYAYLLCLILFGTCTFSQAQEDNFQRKDSNSNYLKFEFSGVGASINLAGRSSGADRNLLGDRSDIGYSATILRVTHLFSDKLGWYGAFKIDLYKERKSPYYQASFMQDFGEGLGILFFGGHHPSGVYEGGLVYRVTRKKWDINPRIGFGYGSLLLDRDSDRSKKEEDGRVSRAVYKQRSASSLISMGVGAHYFFGKRSFIALNAALQQPLNKSYGELTTFIDDVQKENRKYSSSSIGREFNLSVGYGFRIGKRNLSKE